MRAGGAKNAYDSARAAEPSIGWARKVEHMKTSAQRAGSTEIIDLVPEILNLKKILVPIDFSPMSKKAFQYATRFAEQFGCEIVLLHVIEPVTAIAGAPLAVDIFPQTEEETIAAEAELTCLAKSSANYGNSFNFSRAHRACAE
jgi:hypothetical protein